MAEILEAVMLICFGLSWPMNAYKNYKARTAAGSKLAVHSAHHARLRCGYRGEVRIGFSELGISGLLHQLGVHRRELGGLRAQPQARRPSLPRRLCVRVAPRAASAFERALWPASSAAQDAHGAAGDVLLARREPAACSAMRIVASSPVPVFVLAHAPVPRALALRSPRARFCPELPRGRHVLVISSLLVSAIAKKNTDIVPMRVGAFAKNG